MAGARKISGSTTHSKAAKSPKGARRPPVIPPRTPRNPAPSKTLSPSVPGLLSVGIGASAGGLESMEEFFRQMPPESGIAFVVVSHQQAGHVSLLPSLLGKCTAMPVVEAADGMPLVPNHVYLAPGGTHLAILHGVLHIMETDGVDRVPLPIDYFFRSLAEDQNQ